MKNKIAVNSKYFSKTQAKGEMAHVKREFAHDRNVLNPEYTKRNFGTSSERIDTAYQHAVKQMPKGVKNSLIDSVLVLPLDQIKQVTKDHPNDFKKVLHESIVGMMKEMEQEMGFMPIGYQVHLDEGHIDPDTGREVLNPHAHLLFANVCTQDITLKKTKKITLKGADGKALKDPKKPNKYLYELDENGKPKEETIEIPLKGRAPLSLHQTRGKDSIWAKQQDIAAKHLNHLGFERGIGKELTGAMHHSKQQHVARELRRAEKELESSKLLTASLKREIKDLRNAMTLRQGDLDNFIELREKHFADQLSNVPDLSLEAILDAFDEIPQPMQEAALKSTQERVFDMRNSLSAEQNKTNDLFMSEINAKTEEKKVEKEAPSPAPRKFGM